MVVDFASQVVKNIIVYSSQFVLVTLMVKYVSYVVNNVSRLLKCLTLPHKCLKVDEFVCDYKHVLVILMVK